MFVRNVSTDGTAVCQPDKQSTLSRVSVNSIKTYLLHLFQWILQPSLSADWRIDYTQTINYAFGSGDLFFNVSLSALPVDLFFKPSHITVLGGSQKK